MLLLHVAGDSGATLALLEVTPKDGLGEKYEGIVYMDVQMMVVCDGKERSKVGGFCISIHAIVLLGQFDDGPLIGGIV